MIEAKYIELSEKIAEKIRNGEWQGRMPGVIKLSKELNVNPATVAKAFKVLADKGLLLIEGTKGTFIVPQKQRQKFKLIGIVGLDENDVYSEEWQAMGKAALKAGYRIIGISHNNELFADDLTLLLQMPVDAYIFLYSSINQEIAEFLNKNKIPFVACSNVAGIPDINFVDFNSEELFETALRYHIGQGHKHIAYVEFHSENYNYSKRISGVYKRILKESSLPFSPELFISHESCPYANKYGVSAFYQYGFDSAGIIMRMDLKPSAVIFTSTDMGKGFLEGLKKGSLKCPEDISVIVYGPKKGTEEFFTHIRLDYRKRAGAAVEMLLDMLENKPLKNDRVFIKSQLICKKSTASFKTK